MVLKAGIFNNQVEEVGDEGSRECSRKEDTTTTTTVDVSSENSGPLRSRSEDDDDDGDDDDGSKKKKKRRKYHRHTAEQIREMEAYVNNVFIFFFFCFSSFTINDKIFAHTCLDIIIDALNYYNNK
ncbi:hypothetical protein ACGRWE_00195 [Candidatus Phytoplasma australasiaticum]